MTDTVK